MFPHFLSLFILLFALASPAFAKSETFHDRYNALRTDLTGVHTVDLKRDRKFLLWAAKKSTEPSTKKSRPVFNALFEKVCEGSDATFDFDLFYSFVEEIKSSKILLKCLKKMQISQSSEAAAFLEEWKRRAPLALHSSGIDAYVLFQADPDFRNVHGALSAFLELLKGRSFLAPWLQIAASQNFLIDEDIRDFFADAVQRGVLTSDEFGGMVANPVAPLKQVFGNVFFKVLFDQATARRPLSSADLARIHEFSDVVSESLEGSTSKATRPLSVLIPLHEPKFLSDISDQVISGAMTADEIFDAITNDRRIEELRSSFKNPIGFFNSIHIPSDYSYDGIDRARAFQGVDRYTIDGAEFLMKTTGIKFIETSPGAYMILKVGPHPMNLYARDLFLKTGHDVYFAPSLLSKKSGGHVHYLLRRQVLGFEWLQELSPESAIVKHERVHSMTNANFDSQQGDSFWMASLNFKAEQPQLKGYETYFRIDELKATVAEIRFYSNFSVAQKPDTHTKRLAALKRLKAFNKALKDVLEHLTLPGNDALERARGKYDKVRNADEYRIVLNMREYGRIIFKLPVFRLGKKKNNIHELRRQIQLMETVTKSVDEIVGAGNATACGIVL